MDPQNQNPQNPPTPVNADEGGVPIASSGTVITPTNSMENPVNATPAAPMPAAPIQQPAAQLSPVPLPPPPPAAMPPAAPLPAAPAPSGPKRSKKPFIFIFILLLIIGAVAAFYFGYYANPKVIYGQALNNTGKGYNKLIDYVDAQSKLDSAGFTGSGSYTFKTADGTSTDGKVSLVGDHKNVDFNGDIGLGVTRIKGEVRVLDSGTATPDLYVKMTGVKGAGSLLGEPDLDAGLATLDGQWIVVDHTMLDNLSNNFTGTTAALKNAGSPTRDQVLDEMRALGKVLKPLMVTKRFIMWSAGKRLMSRSTSLLKRTPSRPANSMPGFQPVATTNQSRVLLKNCRPQPTASPIRTISTSGSISRST
jgi:hypothetical protein